MLMSMLKNLTASQVLDWFYVSLTHITAAQLVECSILIINVTGAIYIARMNRKGFFWFVLGSLTGIGYFVWNHQWFLTLQCMVFAVINLYGLKDWKQKQTKLNTFPN